jgi:hypothetical protein
MLKIYCTECGSPTNYTSSKPKFCSACGSPFDKLVVNKVQLQKPTITKENIYKKPINQSKNSFIDDQEDYDDDDIQDVNNVPNIRSLDVELQANDMQKVKIGEIAGTGASFKRQRNKTSKKLTKADKKKFLEEWQREAGAIRPKTRGRKNG